MSYQVLARKWRPKKFQDVVGQSHITRSMQNAILKNKIGHAFMLVGTRGVGKTSLARIFAKAIRCENLTHDGNPCGECSACLDFDSETSMNFIEIDGASNNSVDNIRELIGNVHYLPTNGKYKVYVIDEVHMLSTNAFNALLKTLEEPPSHVIFIFATTEPQKLLGTVLSRCQRFDFRNISVADLTSHLSMIANAEGIRFERPDLVQQIAILGKGSARDSLSLLDQVLTFSENNFVKEQTLTSSLGIAGPEAIKALSTALLNGDVHEVAKFYNKLLEENVPVKNIASSLLDDLFLGIQQVKELYSPAELIWVYETIARETTWIFSSIVPEKAFEVCLSKVTLRRTFFNQKINNDSFQGGDASHVSLVKKEEKVETVAEKLQGFIQEAVLAQEERVSVEQKKVENEALNALEEKKVSIEEKVNKIFTWEGFLNALSAKSPASASNLEQGNILSPIQHTKESLKVELGFSYSGQVFYDYLTEPEVYQKLLNNLSEYFELPLAQIHIEIKQLASGKEFLSQAEIRENQAQKNYTDKIEEFKNNPLLKEAEKIFNSKVDKVVLDNKK